MVEPPTRGNSAKEVLGKPLDPAAAKALKGLVNDLEEALLVEAARQSTSDHVSEDDLLLAYKRLSFPNPDALQFADAQAVISQALHENQWVEWVSYGMAVILFVFGLVLLSIGAAVGDVSTRVGALVSGSIVELLILIPFRFAINSRRHNIALRMLGLILNRVHDPKQVAPLLKDTFVAVVLGKAQFKVVREIMRDWLRRIDEALFYPPHTFETVLAYVVVRLRLDLTPMPDEAASEHLPTPQPSSASAPP